MKKILVIVSIFFISGNLFAQEFSVVTINAWPGLEENGFLNCREYETEEVRLFRGEVLSAGLLKLNADIVVLNGINPAPGAAKEIAGQLGMDFNAWVSKSGIRIGPASLPLNLKTGDAILTKAELSSIPAGRKILNGGISNSTFTLFSRNGTQIIGSKVNIDGKDLYIFSAEWSQSIFSDRRSLEFLLDAYLSSEIEPEAYSELIRDAVTGAALRMTQAEETLAFINSTAGEAPVVLCGSLNALPGSAEMEILISAGFTDVFGKTGKGAGQTWVPAENINIAKMNKTGITSGYRTDYILIRGSGLQPLKAELVFNQPVYGVYPSNRFGVKAELRLSESLSGQ